MSTLPKRKFVFVQGKSQSITFGILRLFWLPLWYPQTFLITPFGILRLFWLPPLISSVFSDYPLWYPQTFRITPFGILRLFWYSFILWSWHCRMIVYFSILRFICTIIFYTLPKGVIRKDWGYQRGNQKSLRIPKGVMRRVWGYQRG
jgi:hypothetical protein